LGRPRLAMPVNFFPNKFRVYQRKTPYQTTRSPSQLFFYLQHPIIELIGPRPAQHLVHRCSLGKNDHYIYPARNVSHL
jgi:hypothetical protein